MTEVVRHERVMEPMLITESVFVSWRELKPIMRDHHVISRAIEKASWDKWDKNSDSIIVEIVPLLAGCTVTLVRIVWK